MTSAASTRELRRRVTEAVDAQRLLESTYDFVSVPSPTGDEARFAERYAEVLAEVGLEATMDYEFTSSPSVVARWPGAGGGPTLQLDGHTDAIVVPHRQPELDFASNVVRGRGAADMKGGLAAIVEALRAIRDVGVFLKGNILVTAHGLHEAPGGDQRTIRSLLRRNVKGDAALIPELNHCSVPVAARGMTIFTFTVGGGGSTMHEVELERREGNPTFACTSLLRELDLLARRLEYEPATVAGRGSVFVGQVHAGDFYNRVPTHAEIVGTRRYTHPHTFDEVRAEMERIGAGVTKETGLEVTVSFHEVGGAYLLAEDEPIVRATRGALVEVTGQEVELAAAPAVGNAVDFVVGGVPAVYHGVNQATAHSDHEEVSAEDLVRCARVIALTAMEFCEIELGGGNDRNGDSATGEGS